jgi:hypothetical protein
VTDLADVAARLAELEARAGVEAAMVRYMCACDVPQGKGQAVAAAFTRDGTWEAVDRPDAEAWAATGTEALVAKFDRNHDRLPFSIHYLTNGRIVVGADGTTARGQWYFFEPCTYRGGVPLWTAGHYDNDLAVEDGVWKIRHLRLRSFFSTRYDRGWVDEPAFDTT